MDAVLKAAYFAIVSPLILAGFCFGLLDVAAPGIVLARRKRALRDKGLGNKDLVGFLPRLFGKDTNWDDPNDAQARRKVRILGITLLLISLSQAYIFLILLPSA